MGKRLFILSVGILFLCGCATTRFITNPSPPQELGISGKDEHLEVNVAHLIIPNGPGAWVKDALWDEYVLTLRNFQDKPLTIEKIRLIDPRGVYIDSGVDPYQLESASKALAEAYKEMGITAAVAAGGSALLLSAAPLAFTPVALVAAPVYFAYVASKGLSGVQDRENITKEFTRRGLTTVTLSGSATITGSAFFPIIPSPKSLVVDYRKGTEMKILEIPLEKLAGLHVAPVKEKKK